MPTRQLGSLSLSEDAGTGGHAGDTSIGNIPDMDEIPDMEEEDLGEDEDAATAAPSKPAVVGNVTAA